MQETIWENIKLPSFPALNKNIKTDVLVIGGGICGILCAYRLSKEGKKVVLVEKNTLCSGRTKRTTAVITALQDAWYADLTKQIGKEKTKLFLEANLEAISEYKRLSEKFSFDFEEVSSYKYSTTNREELYREINALKDLGYTARFTESMEGPLETVGAIEFKNQGQMNPLKLICCLVEGLEIYEHTEIKDIQKNTAYTENYMVHAEDIVVCTGYPFLKLRGIFFPRLTQNKSYVMAVKSPSPTAGNAIGAEANQVYFRSYGDYLIVGGNDQKTGKYKNGFFPVLRYIHDFHPEQDIAYFWVNQDCVSVDGLPYIGRYSKSMKHVYLATGFNLWGMTGAMIGSFLITDLILQRENRYKEVFSPQRNTPLLPLLKNIGSAVLGLMNFRTKRCGHLGCGLYWNEKEEVFECPCHGSKYTKDGEVIFGPAQKNKKG